MNYIKLILMVLFTLIISIILIILVSFCIFSPTLLQKVQNNVTRFWGFVMCKILNVEIIIKGKIPEIPVLIVSNHLSYLDIFTYFNIYNCHFLAKLDISGWPLIGKVINIVGTLFIDRTKKMDLLRVIPIIVDKLKKGANIFFFPEGTSKDGRQLGNFYTSLFECSVRANKPVLVSAISYFVEKSEPYSVNNSVCWHGNEVGLLTHVLRLGKFKKIIAYIQIVEEQFLHPNAKELSEICRGRMLEIFRPSENVDDLDLLREELLGFSDVKFTSPQHLSNSQ